MGSAGAAAFIVLIAGLGAKSEELRTVRVTTGSVTVTGWEKSLIRGNPNLRHYQWHPITSNVQGRQPVRPVKTPDKLYVKKHPAKRHKSVYVKPKHIKTVVGEKPSQKAYKQARLPERNVVGNIHYKHIPAPERSRDTQLSYKHAGLPERNVTGNIHYKHVEAGHYARGRLADRKVAARLSQPAPESAMAIPEVLAYPDVYGQIRSGETSGHLYTKDVHGRISGARPF